mgnify:CR=1 FL=1
MIINRSFRACFRRLYTSWLSCPWWVPKPCFIIQIEFLRIMQPWHTGNNYSRIFSQWFSVYISYRIDTCKPIHNNFRQRINNFQFERLDNEKNIFISKWSWNFAWLYTELGTKFSDSIRLKRVTEVITNFCINLRQLNFHALKINQRIGN